MFFFILLYRRILLGLAGLGLPKFLRNKAVVSPRLTGIKAKPLPRIFVDFVQFCLSVVAQLTLLLVSLLWGQLPPTGSNHPFGGRLHLPVANLLVRQSLTPPCLSFAKLGLAGLRSYSTRPSSCLSENLPALIRA